VVIGVAGCRAMIRICYGQGQCQNAHAGPVQILKVYTSLASFPGCRKNSLGTRLLPGYVFCGHR